MTANPYTVAPEQPFGYALNLMVQKGFRHLPVVENGKPIGIVSALGAAVIAVMIVAWACAMLLARGSPAPAAVS